MAELNKSPEQGIVLFRKRKDLTPSGATPDPKRQENINVRCNTQQRWSIEEKKTLHKKVKETGDDKVNWQEVAQQHSEMFGIQRSAKACHSTYLRYSAFSKEDEVHCLSHDMETQTFISIPPSVNVMWSYVPDVQQDSTPPSDHDKQQMYICTKPTNMSKDTVEDADEGQQIQRDHCYNKDSEKKIKRRERAIAKRVKFNNKVSNSLIDFLNRSDHSLHYQENFNLKLVLSLTNNPDHISTAILAQSKLKEKILDKVCTSLGERTKHMRNRTDGFTSVLMKKSPADLENLHLGDIIEEFKQKFPELLQMVLSVMVPPEKLENEEHLAQIVPRVALIYSVMIQSRCKELSRLQRVLSLCMADSISDQADTMCSRVW